MTNTARIQNEFEWQIRGQADISAAAAVTAYRGTNQVVTKTAVGTYTVVVKGNEALKLVELLNEQAWFSSTVPAGATGVRVASVVQSSTTDDITITLKTMASPNTGADTDLSAATKINWDVVIRVGKMGNPL